MSAQFTRAHQRQIDNMAEDDEQIVADTRAKRLDAERPGVDEIAIAPVGRAFAAFRWVSGRAVPDTVGRAAHPEDYIA